MQLNSPTGIDASKLRNQYAGMIGYLFMLGLIIHEVF